MNMRWKAWMVVSVLAGPLMAFGGAESETGTVAERILQEAEDSVKQIKTLIKDAQRGDPEAQYQLGFMIRNKFNQYEGPNDLQAIQAHHKARSGALLEARTWFARAAEQGHDGAQLALYRLYRRKYPPGYSLMPDYVRAYAWLKVALDKGASAHVNGQPAEKMLRGKMTAEQLTEAEKLAAEIEERIQSSQSQDE